MIVNICLLRGVACSSPAHVTRRVRQAEKPLVNLVRAGAGGMQGDTLLIRTGIGMLPTYCAVFYTLSWASSGFRSARGSRLPVTERVAASSAL
jgi:hypothetical protein